MLQPNKSTASCRVPENYQVTDRGLSKGTNVNTGYMAHLHSPLLRSEFKLKLCSLVAIRSQPGDSKPRTCLRGGVLSTRGTQSNAHRLSSPELRVNTLICASVHWMGASLDGDSMSSLPRMSYDYSLQSCLCNPPLWSRPLGLETQSWWTWSGPTPNSLSHSSFGWLPRGKEFFLTRSSEELYMTTMNATLSGNAPRSPRDGSRKRRLSLSAPVENL